MNGIVLERMASRTGLEVLGTVVFQKWRWPLLYYPSKGISVDKQANDDVMHLRRFRKADGLAHQALDTRP